MLKTIIMLPDKTEISSGAGGANAIQKSTIVECVNSENELTIGSVCANQFKATIFSPEGQLNIDAGTEVAVLKEDDGGQRYPVGCFILDKPTRASANTFSVTGYDMVSKLDKDLTAWLSGLAGWPYAVTTFADMVCKACGVPFKETDVPNKDFQIQKFTRTAVTGRQLMRWLGEICCSFCRADRDGVIEFAWYTGSGVEITTSGEPYYFQNGLTFEDYTVAPVEAVQLRMADSENGALWPAAAEGSNSYIITGNPILSAQVTEELLPHLNVICDRLRSAVYTPCKVELPASMQIHAGDTVRITDKNGKTITTFVMTKTQSGQKDTLESTGSARRDNSGSVNNPTQRDQASTMENYANAAASGAAKQAIDRQTQEELFKKLTNDGEIQGLFTENGTWVLNAAIAKVINLIATNIVTGILQSKDGETFYLDLDNGILKMKASSLSISGKTVKEIADESAKTEAAAAVAGQTQEDVFNKLTNDGEIQGLFTEDNVWVLNAAIAKVRNLIADSITSGILKSKDGKTYFNLDTGEFVSVAENGTKVAVSRGTVKVFNSAGVTRTVIERLGDDNHYIIGLNDNSGNLSGGLGVFGDRFGIFAYDGNGVSGGPARWKDIDGVQYLVRESW